MIFDTSFVNAIIVPLYILYIYNQMKKSYKGLYRPTHPNKYIGDVTRIVYRSLLERKFMLYCDRNPDITYWASEELSIR